MPATHRYTALPPGTSESFIDLSGVRTRFLTAGTGPVPLILLHGIASSADTWLPTIPALTLTHTIYAPDLLGCGATDAPPSASYTPEEMLAHFTAFVTYLALPCADINGWSMGGRIALSFAKAHPSAVRKLVLTAPAGLATPAHYLSRMASLPAAASAMLNLPVAIGNWGYFRAAWVAKPGAPRSVVDGTAAQLRAPGGMATFLKMLRGFVDGDGYILDCVYELREGLDKVTCPVMAMWGREDVMTPIKPAEGLSDCFKDYRLEVFEDCGHHPHHEHTRLYNDLLVSFLTK